jgi:hypothetical protein
MIVRFWIQQNVLYHTAKNFGVVFNIHGPYWRLAQVVKALQTIPRVNERFYFWSGTGNLEIAVSGWQNESES